MTDYENIVVQDAGPVRTLVLNRADALNSFIQAMRLELGDALRKAAVDKAVRVVVLRGEGRAFSAGADLKEFQGNKLSTDYTVEEQLNIEYQPVFKTIRTMDKPVIAAVNGSAAGIALAIALVSDIVVMADNAFFLSPFTTISLVGDGGANWLLCRQLGYKRAFELSIMSERITAEAALEYGLANHVFPADEFAKSTEEYAVKVAARAPRSIAATKKAMRFAEDNSYEETFALEASLQRELLYSKDNVEGVDAFLNKRKATFTGE